MAPTMAIGTSIFLIALGAILRYAVKDSIEGVELQVVGLILMIAGLVGALIGIWRLGRADPHAGEYGRR